MFAETVAITRGFPESARSAVAAIYWHAFASKLGTILGPAERALPFLARQFNPAFALAATCKAGRILGVAGFRTREGGFNAGTYRQLAGHYGAIGAAWRYPFLALLERPIKEGQLSLDGIAVAPEARGKGVGGLLLAALFDEARQRGMDTIRLDVIDVNTRARALYERSGYRPAKTTQLGPFRRVYGFAVVTTMVAPVPPSTTEPLASDGPTE